MNKENISSKSNTFKAPLVKDTCKAPQSFQQKEMQQKLVNIHQSRDHAQAKYENIITSLQGIMQDLVQRNDWLVRDREALLREQIQLKQRNGCLNSMVESKLRLSDRLMNQDIDIFDIIVQNTTFSRSESRQEQSDDLPTVQITDANSQVFQRNELAISSVPLSYNLSINQHQISMSNIGQTINQSFRNTANDKPQSIFVQCSSLKPEGIIRAFYLSAMQQRETTVRLSAVIQSLKNDIISTIYQPYPNNQFWTDMLCNFLRVLHQGHFDTQVEVLEYLKAHRLIDGLIIKCLRTRIQFLFDEGDRDNFTVREVLTALANEFGMKMRLSGKQYFFFVKEEKQYNLLYSQQEQSEGSLQSDKDEQPYFTIVQKDQTLHLPFFIEILQQTQEQGLSSAQIKQVLEFQQKLHSFRRSEQNTVMNGHQGSEWGDSDGVLQIKDFNSTDGGRGLRRMAPFRDNKASKQSSECLVLESSRFFLNRVCSKKSDFEIQQCL